MSANEFVFDAVDALYCNRNKISLSRGRLYTDSPKWLKNRKATINPFIDQYNWKGIDFPLHSKDWKKFESNNKSIPVNILYVPHNTEKIRHAYK